MSSNEPIRHSGVHAQATHTWPKPPLPNSYWVEPGRVLAGEYPGGASLSDTTERLQKLLAAGVTLFVNLTDARELSNYEELLEYVQGDRPIQHIRHRIPDHGVPDSAQVMVQALDAIDAHLANGGTVYVHCRAGIGRTGMAIACYLVRSGLDVDEALDRLDELWLECERSRTWPSVPETKEQIEFVRAWPDLDPVIRRQREQSTELHARFTGALLGMAVGDALGALVRIQPTERGGAREYVNELLSGGPFDLPQGAWLADTAMCWCLAESLLACRGSQADDQMQRYLAWQSEGRCSSTGEAIDVPPDVRKALAQWQWTRKAMAGSHDPNNRDAHALARTLAIALYFVRDPGRALIEAGEAARTTIQSPIALDAARVLATLLLDALSGVDKETLLTLKQSDCAQRLRRNRLKPQITQLLDGWWRGPSPPANDGRDVLAVLSTTLWAFEQTDNFRDALVMAVNSCANPSTGGAVCGALCGAYYGLNGIPQPWRQVVSQSQALTDLAQRLVAHVEAST